MILDKDKRNSRLEENEKDVSEKYGIKTKIVHITPELAREYLRQNTENIRKINTNVVDRYADDIKAGLWEVNGEAIHFNNSGKLVNGQHRLSAIIKAGKPVDCMVVYGVPDNHAHVYDMNTVRKTRDLLRVQGIELPLPATAAARILVTMFKVAGRNQETAYALKHEGELRRAYRATCSEAGGTVSKKASCVLASYLMLRTTNAQMFDITAFYRVFNTKNPALASGRDASSAVIAREMFDDLKGTRLQRTQLEIVVRALKDFMDGKHVDTMYEVRTPFAWEALANEVRKADGLDDNS